ncbi:MAG: response regulator [Gemmatimonadota bacterium]|jgi:two-component system, OmpR family, response regulator
MNETTVLLVDDEEEFLAALAARLEMRSLAVDTATTGTAALEKAEQRTYDAILLDMAMPGLDGLSTLKRLLAINADLQVIVLTGRATLAQAVEAMKAGALDLIEKPADIDTLVARIEEAARRRSSLDDQRVQRRIEEITRKMGW